MSKDSADQIEVSSGFPFMRRIATSFGVVVVVAVVGAWLVPSLLPTAVVNGLAERLIGGFLGQPIIVEGAARIALLPKLRLDVEKLRARPVGGGERPARFEIGRIELVAATLPLLASRVDVDRLVIEHPIIRIDIDDQGNSNWPATGAIRKTAGPIAEPNLDWGWWSDFQVRELRVSGGRIDYVSARSGRALVARDLNLTSSTTHTAKGAPGMEISGDLALNDEPVEVSIVTDSPRKFLTGARLTVVGEVKSRFLRLRYQGAAAKREFLVTEGVLTADAGDAAKVEAWLGNLFARPIDGAFRLRAGLTVAADRLEISDLAMALADMEVTGDLRMRAAKKAFLSEGAIKVNALDLSLFGAPAGGGTGIGAIAAALAPANLAGSLNLSWESVRHGALVAGPGGAKITFVEDRPVIAVDYQVAPVFDGRGSGKIEIGSAEGMTSVTATLAFTKIKMGQALEQLFGVAALAGTGDVSVELLSVGPTPADMMAALRGKGRYNILNGFLLDPGLVRHLTEKPTEHLPFSQLVGSFVVRQGVIAGEDLLVKATNMSLVGAGRIDLAADTVDIDLRSLTDIDGSGKRRVKPFKIVGRLSDFQIRALQP